MVANAIQNESLELELANAVARYHREQQGRSPGRIKVSIAGNLIVVVTNDIYTPSEEQLSRDDEGRAIIKSARRELRSLTRDRAHAEIAGVCGCPVLRSYWDIDSRVGEQIEVYVLGNPL
jgi:uncharacterized protein YbcI